MKSTVCPHIAIPVILFVFPIVVFAQSPIELILTIPGGTDRDFMVGETIAFDLSFCNTTDSVLYVTKPLDGSLWEFRLPLYRESVKEPADLYPAPFMPLCGTVNPLQESDFIRLEPGVITPLQMDYVLFQYKPRMAGVHEMAYEIDLDGSWESYAGNDGYNTPIELKELWELIPKVKIRSATVSIHVVSNGKTLDPTYHCLMGMPEEEVNRVFQSVSSSWISSQNYLPYPYFNLTLHYDSDRIVDGVKLISNYPTLYRLDESYQHLLRGGIDTILERIEYQEGIMSSIRVGYFADPSAISHRVFSSYR